MLNGMHDGASGGTSDDRLDGPVATVDLQALEHNLGRIRRRLSGGTRVLAAVKADGYGHGAVTVARRLAERGVRWFGVATPEEAFALRAAGVSGDILLFGPAYRADTLRRLADEAVAVTLADGAGLEAAQAAGTARPLRLHLKVDTGMGRLGAPWQDAAALARRVERSPGLELEAVWTHFARSDESDRAPTLAQLERFERVLDALRADGITPPLRHAANSAAVFGFPEAHYDLVRPGIALYGYHSADAVQALEAGLRPVMRLQAPVTFFKRVPAGTAVSYGGTWVAPHETNIATVRIGYADGLPRLLSNRGSASLRERSLPIVGRVCMDQLLLDVGDLEVTPGEVVTLWGPPGPDAQSVARLADTISYELLTGVSPRVPRRYRG